MTHMTSSVEINSTNFSWYTNISVYGSTPTASNESVAYTTAMASDSGGAAQTVIVVGLGLSQGAAAKIRYFCLSVLGALAVLGNALTLLAVATTDRLRVKTFALTTSLAVADLIIGISLIEFVAHDAAVPATCSMATYKGIARQIQRMLIYASFMHVAVIAIDRFIAIVHSLHYETSVTPTILRRVIATIWIVAAAASLPPLVGLNPNLVVPSQSCIVTLWPIFEAVVELVIYVVNSSIVVVVYSKIWSVAMRHEEAEERRQQHHEQVTSMASRQRPSVVVSPPVDDSVASENFDVSGERLPPITEKVVVVSAKRSSSTVSPSITTGRQPGCWCRRRLAKKYRATRTIMLILAAYVMLWFPYFMSRLLGVVLTNPTALVLVQLFQTITSIFGMLNFGINVFIYTTTNGDFRRAFKRLLRIRTATVHPGYINAIAK